jgi:mannonate dehydratase
MKLGLAFSSRMITRDNFRFARQAGVTHLVLHLTDYQFGHDRLPEHSRTAAGYTDKE